ncbi:hypothetical protein AJ80_09052 [Polytolypa hystricis UAMH7299]|uniref:Uncharacterized protein n=1 Tax=Polytolypa hystricis (strain UAMH7299) TaxID=1447883 RepID=A0A2B7WX58_POLH7|nr:hypothetical protein AJ80_09052 [Polytolypa hystricis UAMH7299]
MASIHNAFIQRLYSWIPCWTRCWSCENAQWKANKIYSKLEEIEEELLENYHHRTDILDTVRKAMETLREENGGLTPADFLDKWHSDYHNGTESLYYTSEQRAAVDRVIKKWNDRSSRDHEFSFLDMYPRYYHSYEDMEYVEEEQALDAALATQGWLRKKRAECPKLDCSRISFRKIKIERMEEEVRDLQSLMAMEEYNIVREELEAELESETLLS